MWKLGCEKTAKRSVYYLIQCYGLVKNFAQSY